MINKLLFTILTAVLFDSSIHITHSYLLNHQEETVRNGDYFPLILLSTLVVYTLTLLRSKRIGVFDLTPRYEVRVLKALLICIVVIILTPLVAILYWMVEYGNIIKYVQSHDWEGQFSSLINWYLVKFAIGSIAALLFSIRLKSHQNKEVELNEEYR